MKKHPAIVLLITILFSFTGCGTDTQPTASEQPSTLPLKHPSITEPVKTPKPPNSIQDSITYVKYGNSYLPISYINGQKQGLTGDGGWYFTVEEQISDAPKAGELPSFNILDMYEKGSEIPATTNDHYRIFANGAILSNGNWAFFPDKVRYEKYLLENQPHNPEWEQYFNNRIAAVSNETPLIFVEAWLFDWNMDGKEDAFVNASNTVVSRDDNTPNPPYGEHTAIYTLSVLFLSGNEPIEAAGVIITDIDKEPLNDEKNITVSYNISEESPEWIEHFISAIQLDKQGNLIKCPIFNRGEYGRVYEAEMLLCDIDGDGTSELITGRFSIYSPVIVYKLVGGKPVEVFRITTPA